MSEKQNLDNFLVFVQQGDKTPDYRLAVKEIGKKNYIIKKGGSHSYENYRKDLPHIFDYLLSRIS